MLIGLNIVLCNPGGWVVRSDIWWSPWRPGLVKSLIHLLIFDMWPTEDARGGPGRASSVAEGRERVTLDPPSAHVLEFPI